MLDHENPAAKVAAMRSVSTATTQPMKRMGDYETRFSVTAPTPHLKKGSKRPVASIVLGPMVPIQLGWTQDTRLSMKYDTNSLYLYPDPNGSWSPHLSSTNVDGSRRILKVAFALRDGMPYSKSNKRLPSTPVVWTKHEDGIIVELPTPF